MNRAIKYLLSFRCVALLCALLFIQKASGQTLPFYGDSSRFSPLKNSAGNEVIIESSSKAIHGALVNYANGRTHFKLVIDTVFSLNDSTLRFRFTDNTTKDVVTHGSGAVTVETDPVAIAKTITVTPGIGMLGSASTQALNVNPSFTTNIDTFAISTRAWRQKLADSLGAIVSTKIFVDTAFTVPAVYTDTVKYTKNGNTYTAALIDHTDDRLFGLTVTSGGGLTLNVTSGAFRLLDGNRYTSAGGSTTLATADASLPRKDVIYVDNTGAIGHITGTPATNPTTPQVDPVTQLLLTEVNVDAGATSISVTPTIIYDEPSTDAFTGTNTGVTVNYTNTSNVQHLTQSADVGSWTNGQTITFTKNSGTLVASDFSNISGFIKLKSALASTANIRISFLNGTTVVSNVITLAAAQGFSKTVLTYQNIAIPISAFTFSSTTFNKIRITLAGTGGGFYLDFVQLQNGISQSTQETDPIADAKTVTITPGVGMLGSVSAQTLINNPSFTTNVDTFAIETRARGLKLIDSLKTVANSSYVPLTRTITINGTTLDLSANRTWTLTTDNVAEGSTNKYYTDARARAAISLTTSGTGAATYNNSTGVLNVPTPAAGGSGTLVHTYAPLVISGDTIYKRFNILSYGATPATALFAAGSISSSSSTLTVTGASFVSGDIGKIIVVKRAGTSGRDLITTIAGVTNSTTVTLTASASSTVDHAQVTYGSDCTTAIQNAVNAADVAGGGDVSVPLGTFIVGGALKTSVGGNNMNAQIYLPYHAVHTTTRVHIRIIGEAKPIAAPQGAVLPSDSITTYSNTGSNLYSTLTSGATDCAVIGTGGSFNESTLSVEDLMIIVANNPTGTGPVVGGISMKNGASVMANNVAIIIDTTGYFSTYPSNDISGIETSDNSHETFNTIENTLVLGFRSGYKIGEHVSLNQAQTMTCFYGFYVKSSSHTSSCLRAGTYWCANDIYVRGGLTVSLFRLDAEWQQSGKWYDDANTIKDSANLLGGDVFYSIIQAFVGINNTKFVKSGGSNVNCYPDATPLVTGTVRSFTSGSIPFSNGTDLAQSNSKLFWNNSTNGLGIGTSTVSDPNGNNALKVVGTANTDVASFSDGTATASMFINNVDANAAVQFGTVSNHRFGIFANNQVPKFILTPGGLTLIGSVTDDGSNRLQVTGNLKLETAGNKILITTGTNASVGTGTLSGGTVTISTTAVTASSLIFIQYTGTLTNSGQLTISSKTAGTSFVVTSSNASDANTFNWWIIN